MSGLLALLDDVAAITKLAAAQLDDIASQAAKAGSKVAGVVIDDAAVTPKYVTGLPAARELPIVWKIAKASYINKLVILLPAALLLDIFLPWTLTPLLMIGGAYLCFEGAEKIWHAINHDDTGASMAQLAAQSQASSSDETTSEQSPPIDMAHLEETRVKGAIKTDFILSAEIMTITMAAIEADDWLNKAAVLAVVAIAITTLVYGTVALLVKADDVGLKLSQSANLAITRRLGEQIVIWMPKVMSLISFIGTAAMLWVGGSIITHGLHDLGWHPIYDAIHAVAVTMAATLGSASGATQWLTEAILNGIIAVILGSILTWLLSRFTNSQS